MSFSLKGKQSIVVILSVLLTTLVVALVAHGITYVDTDSVGIATSTPGGALGVKGAAFIDDFLVITNVNATSSLGVATATPGAGGLGVSEAAIVEGFMSAAYYTSTSTASSWLFGSLGLSTTTPGTGLAVGGAALVEGFVSADYYTSTSTASSWLFGSLGLSTTTPGAGLAVGGLGLVEGGLVASYLNATSTTATSTLNGGFDIASSTIMINVDTGQMVIGTSTFPDADAVAGTQAVDPALTVSGQGSASSATGTVYVTGGAGNGGQIIIKSSNGANCISIMANSGANAVDASNLGANDLLTFKVVECPK